MLAQVLEHPVWAGLRNGTLPGEALVHFVQQDTGYLLPAYARALARCAAVVSDDSHAKLLAHCAFATLEAVWRHCALGWAGAHHGVQLDRPSTSRQHCCPHVWSGGMGRFRT